MHTGWATKIRSELLYPPSKRNLEINDTSFESPNIELLESGKIEGEGGHAVLIEKALFY